MDLIASCRDKLSSFRIKDLKDVLAQLAVTKQGKKQDLIDRILALLSDDQATRFLAGGRRNAIGKEDVAKVIEDAYRKINLSGATNLASESHKLESNYVKSKEEAISVSKMDKRVRCPCGHTLITDSMVKCDEPTCQAWQHVTCVIIAENPTEHAQPEVPHQFYCELCRLQRADPYWLTESHPLLPRLLPDARIMQDGTNNTQTTQTIFQLSRAQKDQLQRPEYDLQVWCILLNDKVPFRMHWPQSIELHVNGFPVRTTNRPPTQLLGVNGRDDGPIINRCVQEGMNKVSLSKSDARVFCFGIRIARRRTVQQVMSLIPKEGEGESFENALARVCRCVGGANAMDAADSDSDIEVVADTVVFNLRCPMSGARIKTAGRFQPCLHMGCFDLGTFVELNQRSRKWQCPICLKNYSLENVIIDPYFNRITKMLQECEEDVDEIDIKPDGSWRVKSEECKDLGQWHLPDGSLLISRPSVKCESEVFKQLKQDEFDEQSNLNGFWVNDKHDLVKSLLPGKCDVQKLGNYYPQTPPFLSSSATGSCREGEDSGINQEGGFIDISAVNAYELDSGLNFGLANISNDIVLPGPSDKDIILLTDSEDDNATPVTTRQDYDYPCSFPFPAIDPGVSGMCPEAPGAGTIVEPCMEIFGNGHDFGVPSWPVATCTQKDATVCTQTASIGNTITDAPHSTFCWSLANGSASAMGNAEIDVLQTDDFFSFHATAEDSSVLMDNPMALNPDPSLQIFLPTQPLGASVLRNLTVQEEIPDTFAASDWISLRVGDPELDRAGSTSAGDFHPVRQFLPKQNFLHLSMNGDDSSNRVVVNPQRPNDTTRSVKPRLSLFPD